jgi:hypothetical protein
MVFKVKIFQEGNKNNGYISIGKKSGKGNPCTVVEAMACVARHRDIVLLKNVVDFPRKL